MPPLTKPSTLPDYAGWTDSDALLGIHQQLLKLNARQAGVDGTLIDDPVNTGEDLTTNMAAIAAAAKSDRGG